MQNKIIEKIKLLKKEKNAIVLAHTYQNIEIDEVADFTGDSLYLSRMAANTDADIIVFAGVYFMAETAKILSPKKKVLLPNMNSGCLMADMINLQQLRAFKQKHPNIPVVCYVNSTAAVKSESDVCCTSANAVEVVRKLGAKEVLFVPDTYLGSYVGERLKNVKVITYPGHCPTHFSLRADDVAKMKADYPQAKVLAHPECRSEVLELADFVGSTTAIIKNASESSCKSFVIVTEKGVVDRLKRDYPQKEFILVSEKAVCPSMKLNTLEDILNVLEQESNEITVDADISSRAYATIDRMLKM